MNYIKYLWQYIYMFAYYFLGNIRASYLGVKLGIGTRISPFAKLDNVYFIGDAKISTDVEMGEGSYINSGTIFSAKIGRFCSIGYNVMIGPTEHETNQITTSPSKAKLLGLPAGYTDKITPKPILEDEVWIGAGVIILRGVVIGANSIVGAGAVVTKNIPPNEIWGGVPARFIKKRNVQSDLNSHMEQK